MLDVKKRLTSFLPSSARSQLQNVLTVEWDTHKTVLVDVSGENARSNDVEMSGMSGPGSSGAGGGDSLSGRDRSEYGRLEDDEESDGLFNRPAMGKPRSSWAGTTLYGTQGSRNGKSRSRGNSDARTKSYGYPSHDTNDERESSFSYSAYSQPGERGRREEDNPFDENSPSYKSSLGQADPEYEAAFGHGSRHAQHSHSGQTDRRANASRRGRDEWDDLSGGGGGGSAGGGHQYGYEDERKYGLHNPATLPRGDGVGTGTGTGSDPWGTGGWSAATSPTSSRGTRDSGRQGAEDPFR